LVTATRVDATRRRPYRATVLPRRHRGSLLRPTATRHRGSLLRPAATRRGDLRSSPTPALLLHTADLLRRDLRERVAMLLG
jgi:hypothetical protein